MEKASIRDNELEYSIHGTNGGEWIVLIHGSVFADMFLPMISQPDLSKYSILHYYREGYGNSTYDKASTPSINKLASDCLDLMNFLNIDSAHIVSHSYAGLIALQAAVDTPTRMHTVTLMEPPLAAFVPSGKEFGDKLMTSFGLYQQGKNFEALDYFLKVVFEGTQDYRKIIDNKLGNRAFNNAISILDTMFQLEFPALQSWKFDPSNVKSLTMPILSVNGTDSALFFKEVQSLLHKWFPQSETLTIPSSSHILHMQEPEIVAEGLRSFFAKHPIQ